MFDYFKIGIYVVLIDVGYVRVLY